MSLASRRCQRYARGVELHRGINFSQLEIPPDAGGLIFTVGSVIALLIAIPSFRWFLLGVLAAAGEPARVRP